MQVIRLFPAEEQRLLNREMRQMPEEIRLRAGHAPMALVQGTERPICGMERCRITPELLQTVLQNAVQHSVYAYSEQLRFGSVTIDGGHRISLCGIGVYKNGQLEGFRTLSSVSIRIAGHTVPEIAPPVCSTLILGPPGWGKTTLLRGCIRSLSDSGQRICVADERYEIAGSHCGNSGYDLGAHTDLISGVRKTEAIRLLLRNMNPQWIAVDELTGEEDLAAIQYASFCGVKLMASVHAGSVSDLERKPLFRSLMQMQLFEQCLILNAQHQYRREALLYGKNRGNRVYPDLLGGSRNDHISECADTAQTGMPSVAADGAV